jgi:hypothetical protein
MVESFKRFKHVVVHFCRQLLVELPEGVKVDDMEDQVIKAATLLKESKHNEQAAERWKGECNGWTS